MSSTRVDVQAAGDLASGLSTASSTVPGRHGEVPVRWYRKPGAAPGKPTVVWIHGGSFSYGSLDQLESHAPACALAQAGWPVVTVDYHLIPPLPLWGFAPPRHLDQGVRFPIPLDDVVDAIAAASYTSGEAGVVVGGASAGACLALAATLALRERDIPAPRGLVLGYGTFHAQLPPASAELRAELAPARFRVFQPWGIARMNLNYAGRVEALDDPTCMPGGHLTTPLPPALLVDAQFDSLRASSQALVREFEQLGVPVRDEVIKGTSHAFLGRPSEPGFRTAINIIEGWLPTLA